MFKKNSYIDEPKYSSYSKYSIFAIILHLGKHMNEGHYICIVKRNKNWYLCDDEDVKEIPEKKILDGNAYLLFYRQEYI